MEGIGGVVVCVDEVVVVGSVVEDEGEGLGTFFGDVMAGAGVEGGDGNGEGEGGCGDGRYWGHGSLSILGGGQHAGQVRWETGASNV